jgi:hypothetical protein
MLWKLMKLALAAIVSFHMKIQSNKMQRLNNMTHLRIIKNKGMFHSYYIWGGNLENNKIKSSTGISLNNYPYTARKWQIYYDRNNLPL